MPDAIHPWEHEPWENRRKRYLEHGGLGGRVSLDGYRSRSELRQHICVQCKTKFNWTPDLDFSDFGEVVDNLCGDCRKVLRKMRTNHPEMK